ncbi:MAG: hypothetical protein QOG91_243 [Candidatus Parcubacteria bacterium]|jgi:hypothetical protein|nr:hypothetical protein [Candidatus Parcubacteria bacterium]
MYLVGEPIFGFNENLERYVAPFSQLEQCWNIFNEKPRVRIEKKLAEEYLAIIVALGELGIDFRVILSRPEADKETIDLCRAAHHVKFAGFTPDYSPSTMMFPRDFATTLPKCVLTNPTVRPVTDMKKGWRIIQSPFGEGGRLLSAGDTVLISDRVRLSGQHSRQTMVAEIKEIESSGVTVGMFPPPVSGFYSVRGVADSIGFDDHIDRVACLVRDRLDFPHLIVDHRLHLANVTGETPLSWELIEPGDAIRLLQERFKPLGIQVHEAPPSIVPYSLNLLQFPDRRVLMTSGVPEIEALIGGLVGSKNVITTRCPIRYYPTWKYGGIRCLVVESPDVLFIGP